MTKNKQNELLKDVFTTVKKDNGEILLCFSDRLLMAEEGTDENKIYKAVSDAMHNSGLSEDFSYEVVSRAVDIIYQNEDIADLDNLNEFIDNAVPVYNSELTRIYLNDWGIVDEAVSEYGTQANDSVKNAQMGWYMAIEQMTQAIINNLAKL